ncbi:MAG TPA: NAD(P)/FAD-dependent oxidoreductase [Candidatus Bathyarchaeia archaeon]|nr:NAD(P)/FAD-dependent oxidoreductase [Candidatus Bathyarchaeia archaeon]
MESSGKTYEAIVVGAGVAGSQAARTAAGNGSSVLLLEEHPQVGVPSHCSGVVSLSGMSLLGVKPHHTFEQRMIYGARFHPPKGDPVLLRKTGPVAVIINRARFDQYMAKLAVAEGAELRTNTRASRFHRTGDGQASISVQDGPSYTGAIIVDASGAGSRLPEQAGLHSPDWSQLLPGLQYEIVETQQQDDMVDLYFGSHRAPGFFAWSIPTGDHSARVGLASRNGNVRKLLDQLVKDYWPKSSVEATKSGSVLVSGPIDDCWAENFLAVGDAAGQVKQTTGGGIVIGGCCGILAGRAASKAARAPWSERRKHLMEYDREWRTKFGHDLRRMGLAHKLISGLSDDTVNRLFLLAGESIQDIADYGDMDFQGEIISRLLRNRRFVSILPRVALDSIRAILS